MITKSDEQQIIFQMNEESPVDVLHLLPYSAAMRRVPPLPGANRLPCMADVVRVDTDCVYLDDENLVYGRNALEAALTYQVERKVPFALASAEKMPFLADYGFAPINDRAQYILNQEQITEEMLQRAEKGEVISLIPSTVTLSVLHKNGLMTLAHFANANLCKKYGLFMIRSAVYYQRLLTQLTQQNGNIFVIMENSRLKGYFILKRNGQFRIQEAIFENVHDFDRYFTVEKSKEPAVIARVVNMAEMLKHIASRGKVTIAIQIEDDMISDNDGLFIWYLDENGSRMERVDMDAGNLSMRPELTVTIGELTSFFFGYRKLKENLKFDSIYLSGPVYVNEMI